MRCLLYLLLLISLSFITSCSSSGYGILAIQSPSGKKLYFRREVRGLNYDSLALSENSNYCTTPEPQSSLIFRSIDPNAFYKFDGEELHIYTMSDVNKPEKLADGIGLVLHKLTNQQFIIMKDNYREVGLQRVDIPIIKGGWCF